MDAHAMGYQLCGDGRLFSENGSGRRKVVWSSLKAGWHGRTQSTPRTTSVGRLKPTIRFKWEE